MTDMTTSKNKFFRVVLNIFRMQFPNSKVNVQGLVFTFPMDYVYKFDSMLKSIGAKADRNDYLSNYEFDTDINKGRYFFKYFKGKEHIVALVDTERNTVIVQDE
jgi:hypothetical protein